MLDVPPELRNRITRFELEAARTAGSVSLTDDSLKRRKIALMAGREDREGLQLLSPTHYLRQALAPTADLLEGGLADVLPAGPDVVILADVARLAETEETALTAHQGRAGRCRHRGAFGDDDFQVSLSGRAAKAAPSSATSSSRSGPSVSVKRS